MAQDHFQTTPDPETGHGRSNNAKRKKNKIRFCQLKGPGPMARNVPYLEWGDDGGAKRAGAGGTGQVRLAGETGGREVQCV